MSAILFSSPSGYTALSGIEGARAIHNTKMAALPHFEALDLAAEGPLRAMLGKPEHSLHGVRLAPALRGLHRQDFTEALHRELDRFYPDLFVVLPTQAPANEWNVVNLGVLLSDTAAVKCSDAHAVLARLAMATYNPWIAGEHRPWFAETIRAGRCDRVLSEGVGWERVADFIAADSNEPVVISMDPYPSMKDAGFALNADPEHQAGLDAEDPDCLNETCDHDDAWYNLAPEVQWERALQLLYPKPRLQLTPQTLRTAPGRGITVDDLPQHYPYASAIPRPFYPGT